MIQPTDRTPCVGGQRERRDGLAALHSPQQQALEIFALGMRHQHRMVDAGSKPLEHLGIDPGIEDRAGDDLLEEIERDCP